MRLTVRIAFNNVALYSMRHLNDLYIMQVHYDMKLCAQGELMVSNSKLLIKWL